MWSARASARSSDVVVLRPIHHAVEEPGHGRLPLAGEDRGVRRRAAPRQPPQDGGVGGVRIGHAVNSTEGPVRSPERRDPRNIDSGALPTEPVVSTAFKSLLGTCAGQVQV